MRVLMIAAVLVAVVGQATSGCNQNPFLSSRQQYPAPAQPQQPAAPFSQLQDLRQRAQQLDVDNRDLQSQVAQLQQQVQLAQEEKSLLRQRLTDAANQLKEIQTAKKEVDQRLDALQASTRQKGGAIITANNSLRDNLPVIDLPGIEVRQDGDVIRISLPADRLFVQGTAQFQPAAFQLLDQAAVSVRQNYPRQIIVIEGHTDNTLSTGVVMNTHQLAANQAVAVFSQLTRSGRLSAKQLRIMSHGDSQPRFSNATPDGRARNRRVELVVYPETIEG